MSPPLGLYGSVSRVQSKDANINYAEKPFPHTILNFNINIKNKQANFYQYISKKVVKLNAVKNRIKTPDSNILTCFLVVGKLLFIDNDYHFQ